MNRQPRRASDKAVLAATGRNWQEWFEVLDGLEAAQLSHKEIVQLIMDKELIAAGQEWWAQGVTVAYEYEKGKRTPGLTLDAGFEVGVQRTLPVAAETLWSFMLSPQGLLLWLGGEIGQFPQDKGEKFKTTNGFEGELRSITPGRKLRLTWQPPERDRPTTVQIYVIDQGKSASLRFHQEKLDSADEREKMRVRWQRVAEEIRSAICQGSEGCISD